MAISFRDLTSVNGVTAANDELSPGQVRWWIFNAKDNGFDSVIVRIGRRVYLDIPLQSLARGSPGNECSLQRFEEWL